MKFTPVITENNRFTGVEIEHDGETVTLNIPTRRNQMVAALELYEPVNSLISSLDPDRLDLLFSAYQRARDLQVVKCTISETLEALTDLHQCIHTAISPVGIETWATAGHGEFPIPPAISEVKVGRYPAHSNYDPEAYSALCGLSTMLKLHIPISAGFMDSLGSISNDFKFNVLFELIDQGELEGVTAYKKLRDYTRELISSGGDVKIPSGLMMEGISDEDTFVTLILAPKLMRDLPLCETNVKIASNGGVNNVTAKITNAIRSQINEFKSGSDYTARKLPTERQDGEGGNISVHEDTQVIERYPKIISMVYNSAAKDPNLAVEEGVDPKVYVAFKDAINNNRENIAITDDKQTILSLVLLRIPSEAFTLIKPDGMRNLLAVACGKLHQARMYQLVKVLCSGHSALGNIPPNSHYVAAEAKPDKELLAKVQERYYETNGGEDTVTREMDHLVSAILGRVSTQYTPTTLDDAYQPGRIFTPDAGFKNEFLKLLLWD